MGVIEIPASQAKEKRVIFTRILFAVIAIVIFLAHIFRIQGIGMPIILADEFGSFANAAYLVGLDWSEIVSYIGYYSFGGSLLYLPIFAIADNAGNVYHAIVVCNALLADIYFAVLYSALKKLYHNTSKIILMCVSFAAALYPSYICYGYTAMYENALLVTFAVIVWMFAAYLTTNHARYLYGVTGATGYLLMVHMRTIGTVCVIVLILLLFMIGKKIPKKHGFGSIGLLVILFGVFYVGKNYFYQNLWRNGEGYLSVYTDTVPNTVSSQFEKIDFIFSGQGIKNLLKLILGQTFYMSTTTLVMGVIFGYVVIKLFFSKLKHRNFWEADASFWVMLLIFAGYLAQLMISCITFIKIPRFDCLFYGRYTEYFYGILFALGFLQLIRKRLRFQEIWLNTLFYLLYGILAWILVKRIAPDLPSCNIVSMTALGAFWKDGYLNLIPIILVACGLYILLTCLVYFPEWKKLSQTTAIRLKEGLPIFGSVCAAIVFFADGTHFTDYYIVPLNQVHENYRKVGNVILENLTEDDEKVEYYNDPSNHSLENIVKFELLQFSLWDIPLQFCDYEDVENADADILITDNLVQPWGNDLFGKYDILYYRGEIIVWERKESNTIHIPATLFQTLCAENADWDKGTYIASGIEGYLVCGAPMSMDSGDYTVTFKVELAESPNANKSVPLFYLDVYQDGNVLSEQEIYAEDIVTDSPVSFSLDIAVSDEESPCEFRIKVAENVNLTASQVQITRNTS